MIDFVNKLQNLLKYFFCGNFIIKLCKLIDKRDIRASCETANVFVQLFNFLFKIDELQLKKISQTEKNKRSKNANKYNFED